MPLLSKDMNMNINMNMSWDMDKGMEMCTDMGMDRDTGTHIYMNTYIHGSRMGTDIRVQQFLNLTYIHPLGDMLVCSNFNFNF
jgi:hypothetical protein